MASARAVDREATVEELQLQLSFIAAMPNEDHRDPKLATGAKLGRKAHDNGFGRQAEHRWPFQELDRRNDPVFARQEPTPENYERDILVPYLAKKVSEGATVSSLVHQLDGAYVAKIDLKKKGENFDFGNMC